MKVKPLMIRISTSRLKIAPSHDRGLIEQAASRDVKGEPDELGVCPGQRSCPSRAGTGREPGLA